MPYFFILPAFLAYAIAMGFVVVLTYAYRPIAILRPYAVSVLIWSSLGFVAATIIYALVAVGSLRVMDAALAGRPSVVGGIAMGGIIFVMPFVASGLGLIGGAAIGLWRTWARAERQKSQGFS